jgi:Kef-type K+ transport system membrane component KefB
VTPEHALGLFLVAITVLIALGWLLGRVAEKLGQPPVIGELLVGILLGPSLLGAALPGLSGELFAHEVMTLLQAVGNVGLILFIFLVGVEVDESSLSRQAGAVAKIAASSFAVPFVAGVAVAVPLFTSQGGDAGSRLAFTLFVGIAFACTAFPVLARILTDRGLAQTSLGATALAAAGGLDLLGWATLAAALAIAAGHGVAGVAFKLLLLVMFVVVLKVLVVPRLLIAVQRAQNRGPARQLALLAAAVFASAGTTQLIGLHSVIGPLLLGLMIPVGTLTTWLRPVRSALTPVTVGILLPVYFTTAGMAVNIPALSSRDIVVMFLLLGLATASKVTGTMAGARWAGYSWRDSLPLGVLLNTRGVMEVVVLNVGLAAGLLSETLYSQLMVVALLATAMTGPLINRLVPRAESSGATPEGHDAPEGTMPKALSHSPRDIWGFDRAGLP